MKRFLISEEEKRNILGMYYPEIIIENKIYPQKIVNQISDKFGITSDVDKEKLKSKLAIAGLWRNVFGDIFSFKTIDEFNSKFDDWYNNFITKLLKTKNFYNKEDEAKKYLNAYVDNIGSIGDTAQLVSDKTLKDYVENNNWIQIEQSSIYNPKDEDILYEDNEIIILKANSKSKCVMYGNGERWCITKPEYNYYNTYRINYNATIYFVLQKNVEYPEHKIVMMVYGENKFSIADQTNTGERTGSQSNVDMSWSKIERELPNLKGKKDYFKYLPPTENEIKYENIIKEPILSDNLQEEIDKILINFPEIKDGDFIRDYSANQHKITIKQLNSLNDETMNGLIESGYFIKNDTPLDEIKNLTQTQKNRILKVKFYHNPTTNLYDSFSENFIKNLILSTTSEKLDEIFYKKYFIYRKFIDDIIRYDKEKLFCDEKLTIFLIKNTFENYFIPQVMNYYGDKIFNHFDIVSILIEKMDGNNDDFIEKTINNIDKDKLKSNNLILTMVKNHSNPIKIYNLIKSDDLNYDNKFIKFILRKSKIDNNFVRDIIDNYNQNELFENVDLLIELIEEYKGNIDNIIENLLNYIIKNNLFSILNITDLLLLFFGKHSNPNKIYNLIGPDKIRKLLTTFHQWDNSEKKYKPLEGDGVLLSNYTRIVSNSNNPLTMFNMIFNEFKNSGLYSEDELLEQKKDFDKHMFNQINDDLGPNKIRQILLIIDKKITKEMIINNHDDKEGLFEYLRTMFSDEELRNFGWLTESKRLNKKVLKESEIRNIVKKIIMSQYL